MLFRSKINKDAWDGALAASGLDRDELLGARDMEAPLPWDGIKLRVSKAYLRREAEKAFASELSPICMEKCTTPCGACSDTVSVQGDDERERIARALDFLEADLGRAGDASSQTEQRPSDGEYRRSRILFSYSKTGNAAYYPHHTLWNLIASAFERSGRFLEYSQGFNPAPRLEISEPLSLGTASREEYGTALLRDSSIDIFGTEDREAVQSFLPEGLSIDFAAVIQGYEGKRIPSLSMLHWGSEFSLAFSAELSLDFEACCLALGHEVARHPALYGASVSHDQATRSCTVLLPFGGKRELGLQSLFKAACGVDLRDTGILVTRLRQFAKSPQGGAISYREFFNV